MKANILAASANEKNPRKIKEEELVALGKAMKEFGDLGSFVLNVETGKLVSGHQRSKHLDPKWKIVKKPVTDKTGTVALGYVETPWGKIGYREVEWSPTKEAAAMIAANKHGGEFDQPMLKSLISELSATPLDMSLTGFSQKELSDMAAEAPEQVIYEQAIQLQLMKEYLVVMCETAEEFEQLKALLKLKVKRRGGYKPGSLMDHIATERVVTYKRLRAVC